MKRGIVIGNCQAAELSATLNMLCRNIRFEAFQVHLETEASILGLKKRASTFDVILSFRLSSAFGMIAENRIGELFGDRVIFISNIHFTGFHPDFVFLGSIRDRLLGPLGNYRSKIVLYAFMRGYGVEGTLALFRPEIYEEFGFFDEYEGNERYFRLRDRQSSVQFADEFFAMSKKQRTLLTFNHPTTVVFLRYAEKISSFLAARVDVDLAGAAFDDVSFYPNALIDAAGLPVYPEIGDRLGLEWHDPYCFKAVASGARPSVFLTLREFVQEEYAAFSAAGHERLGQLPQWQAVKESVFGANAA